MCDFHPRLPPLAAGPDLAPEDFSSPDTTPAPVYVGFNSHAVLLTTKEPNTMKRLTIYTLALALVSAGCGGRTSAPPPTVSYVATVLAKLRTGDEGPPVAHVAAN